MPLCRPIVQTVSSPTDLQRRDPRAQHRDEKATCLRCSRACRRQDGFRPMDSGQRARFSLGYRSAVRCSPPRSRPRSTPRTFRGNRCQHRGPIPVDVDRLTAAHWMRSGGVELVVTVRPRGDEPPLMMRSPHPPDLLALATSESPGGECSRIRLAIQQRELASGVHGGDVFKHPSLSLLGLISDEELGVLELQAVFE